MLFFNKDDTPFAFFALASLFGKVSVLFSVAVASAVTELVPTGCAIGVEVAAQKVCPTSLSAATLAEEEEEEEAEAEAETATGLRGFRGVARRCVEISKSSLKLDMHCLRSQRHHLFAEPTPVFEAFAAVTAKRFPETGVASVAQTDEFGFAVPAGAQTLHVEFGARVVKVKLRALAAVRAGNDAEIARVLQIGTQRAIAQARGCGAAPARRWTARGATRRD